MRKLRNQQIVCRGAVYLLGLAVLALGITLNTKTDLGVSPIISVPYSVADIWGLNLGNTIFVFYTLCVLAQWAILRRQFSWLDFLQIPISLITSQFINLFDWLIQLRIEHTAARLALLAAAIAATGAGAALMVMMELVPNPADALARVIGDKLKKGFGFGKNVFDLTCFAAAVLIGLLFAGRLSGVGAGTVVAVLFTGRAVAAVNLLCKEKLQRLAGMKTGGVDAAEAEALEEPESPAL